MKPKNSMEYYFESRPCETVFLDHASGFQQKVIPMEVRTDRFTGRVSRVIQHRRRRFPEPSHDSRHIDESRSGCPFCSGNVEGATPKFPESLIPGGRLHFGESTVLPNAFPYSRHCGLAILSKEHYVPLNRMTPETLLNALKASALFIQRVAQTDNRVSCASINWNYMMPAGGGLVHPHFQIVVNRHPTCFHQRLCDQSIAYQRATGGNYWTDLIRHEKRSEARYLFAYGNCHFVSVYSPGGMFGEVLAVFEGVTRFAELAEGVLESFSLGLSRTLGCFHRMNLDSLNMTLFISLENVSGFRLQSRIMPRRHLTPHGTSDVNYFEKGHDEIIVTLSPEELAQEIRGPRDC